MMKIHNQVTVIYIGPHDKAERMHPATVRYTMLHTEVMLRDSVNEVYSVKLHFYWVLVDSWQFFQQSYICRVWQHMQKIMYFMEVRHVSEKHLYLQG